MVWEYPYTSVSASRPKAVAKTTCALAMKWWLIPREIRRRMTWRSRWTSPSTPPSPRTPFSCHPAIATYLTSKLRRVPTSSTSKTPIASSGCRRRRVKATLREKVFVCRTRRASRSTLRSCQISSRVLKTWSWSLRRSVSFRLKKFSARSKWNIVWKNLISWTRNSSSKAFSIRWGSESPGKG